MRVLTIFAACAAAVVAGCSEEPIARPVAGGDATVGKRLIEQYQCGACHAIPDTAAGAGTAGPPLSGFARRSYIAGRIPNQGPALIAWLVDPPAVKPGTSMPNLGISEADARHMAAYLYTLHE